MRHFGAGHTGAQTVSQDFLRQLPSLSNQGRRGWLARIHIDPMLLGLLTLLVGFGLVLLYSAIDGDSTAFSRQAWRMGVAFAALIAAAQVPPRLYQYWSPVIYFAGLALLILVIFFGVEAKGSRRWLEIPGVLRFQPSEVMKLVLPMAVAWYFSNRSLPPSLRYTLYSLLIVMLPVLTIAVQPDLGTSILVAASGLSILFLAGVSWRYIGYFVLGAIVLAPTLWVFALKDYQRQRVMTLFDPESDPLGAGWNIIQSTTAIGSGGVTGKGLMQGSQSYLDFLPEARTDFIIAVVGEELGLVGVTALLTLYLLIIIRCFYLANEAGSTFGRLLAGALTITFFVYVFVNIAMVSGLLPVVGVPLPLVSYGGTSAITLMTGFGIIMSMQSHKAW